MSDMSLTVRPIIAVLGLVLAACSTTPADRDGSETPPQAAAATQPGNLQAENRPPVPLRRAAPAASPAEASDEPTLMRGNDRMFAPPQAAPKVRLDGAGVSLKFEQAPVTEVVHAVLGDILKVPYAINQPVTGNITLHTQTPLARDKIFAVFESVLQANGLLVAKDAGGVYHVGRPETLRGVAPVLGTVGRMPAGHSMVIVPLQYVGAGEMAEILQPVATPEAFVRVDTFRNLLILAGSQPQIEGWMQIVSTFDVDVLKGMSLGLFPLKHASVQEVDAGLKALLAGGGMVAAPSGAGSTTPPAQRPATQGQPGGVTGGAAAAEATKVELPSPIAGVVRVIALERLNALLVITPRAHYLDIAREWIAKFDQPRSGGSEPQLYVYPVENGTARHLAELLNAIFGGEGQAGVQGQRQQQRAIAPGLGGGLLGQRTGSSLMGNGGSMLGSGLGAGLGAAGEGVGVAQVALSGNIRVVADDQQNALLIYAPQNEYTKIEAALRKLDIAPTQVLIEASILEVTLSDELKYGLQWYFNDVLGRKGWHGFGQLTMGENNAIGPVNPGFSYSISNPAGQIRAVLSALATKSLLNVISSPSIMVLDNHTAQIHVGDQQPVRSTQTITDGGTTSNSIQYKDTGVMLAVSPSVNAGGMVSMQIEQSVTDVGSVDSATGQRTFLQRQLSSRVAVRDGETLVLGGLIRDNHTNGKQGLPLLHDIPVVGNLFGTTTTVKNRTELLVMLTPRVISNETELRRVGEELQQRMRTLDLLPDRISADFHRVLPVPGEAPAPTPAQ